MGDWPLLAGPNRTESIGYIAASSLITQVSAAASPSEGTWTQLVAATSYAWSGFFLKLLPNSSSTAGADNRYAVEVAIGGAGSEVVLLSKVLTSVNISGNTYHEHPGWIPLQVPAGVRLSARVMSFNGTGTRHVRVGLVGIPKTTRGVPGFHRSISYGFSSGEGTALDAGASANTKGGWVELTASCANPIRALLMSLTMHLGTAAQTASFGLIDIGVGAAGSEQVVVDNVHFSLDSQSDAPAPCMLGPFPMIIPAGTRIAARHQASSNSTTSARQIRVVATGFD